MVGFYCFIRVIKLNLIASNRLIVNDYFELVVTGVRKPIKTEDKENFGLLCLQEFQRHSKRYTHRWMVWTGQVNSTVAPVYVSIEQMSSEHIIKALNISSTFPSSLCNSLSWFKSEDLIPAKRISLFDLLFLLLWLFSVLAGIADLLMSRPFLGFNHSRKR